MTNCKLLQKSWCNFTMAPYIPGLPVSSWKAETLQEFIRVKLNQTILFKSGLLALWVTPESRVVMRNITWCGDGKEKILGRVEVGLIKTDYGKNNKRSKAIEGSGVRHKEGIIESFIEF